VTDRADIAPLLSGCRNPTAKRRPVTLHADTRRSNDYDSSTIPQLGVLDGKRLEEQGRATQAFADCHDERAPA